MNTFSLYNLEIEVDQGRSALFEEILKLHVLILDKNLHVICAEISLKADFI